MLKLPKNKIRTKCIVNSVTYVLKVLYLLSITQYNMSPSKQDGNTAISSFSNIRSDTVRSTNRIAHYSLRLQAYRKDYKFEGRGNRKHSVGI